MPSASSQNCRSSGRGVGSRPSPRQMPRGGGGRLTPCSRRRVFALVRGSDLRLPAVRRRAVRLGALVAGSPPGREHPGVSPVVGTREGREGFGFSPAASPASAPLPVCPRRLFAKAGCRTFSEALRALRGATSSRREERWDTSIPCAGSYESVKSLIRRTGLTTSGALSPPHVAWGHGGRLTSHLTTSTVKCAGRLLGHASLATPVPGRTRPEPQSDTPEPTPQCSARLATKRS